MGAAKPKAPPRPYPSLRHRILANVKREPPPAWTGLRSMCWLWQGDTNARGYAQMSFRRQTYDAHGRPLGKKPRQVLVHRLVLLEFLGIPLDLVEASMHKCSRKPCINPDHVDPGTCAENTQHFYTVERPMRLAIEAAKPMREPGED